MSGATGTTGATGDAGEAEAFAELLRGLKERSGLSYGTLAKRLHMSTSTLHRYCNASAVPNDYAPVERLARVCRATPQELVELHRRWILADAARGRKAAGAGSGAGLAGAGAAVGTGSSTGAGAAGPEGAATPDAPGAGGQLAGADGQLTEATDGTEPASTSADGDLREPHGSTEPVVTATTPPTPVRKRRTALIASVAAAAVVGAAVLAVNLTGDDGGGRDGGKGAGAAPATGTGTGTASATASGRPDDKRPSASPSPSPSAASRSPKPGEPAASESAAPGGGEATAPTDAVPLNVATRPYVYESPCSQYFLVDSEPEQVGPPAAEQDAPRWAAAYGAVSSDEQRIALTVQGTGKETVVLEALHVRVLTKGAPLAWNDYGMGVGCGGGVGTKSFDVDLDQGSPTVTVKNGQRDFPYKVSESDPEVFYLTARTKAHDVRWDLALDWSSGERRGTVHIDNAGSPFRTSANVGRPGYDYPLGGSEWIPRVENTG